jgi:NTE family protein
MEWINKDLILKEIPLFCGLTNKELDYVKPRSEIIEFKKGEMIYEQGSAPSAFYCIILGRVLIYTRDNRGHEVILEYLHRGKYFGIISLLTSEPHSVNTRALNDCLILFIRKESFDQILKKVPKLAIDLSQTLSRRLKNKDLHEKTIFESTIISVFSSYSKAGKSIYALNLALSLHNETKKSVIVLDIFPKDKIPTIAKRLGIGEGYKIFDLSFPLAAVSAIKDFVVRDKFGIDLIFLAYRQDYAASFKKAVDILNLLVNDYHYIVLDLPSGMENYLGNILNQSDIIHLLTSPTQFDLQRTHRLFERLNSDFHFPAAKMRVIVNEHKTSAIANQDRERLIGRDIFATLPNIESGNTDRIILDDSDSQYSKAVRRIARQDGDCMVGLALGVGVAYGFCHIGILKVIEEEKIPVDIICGSSIGALIASLWAIGKSSSEILEITQEFSMPKSIWGLVDLTLPLLGFVKGNKLYSFLKKHLGGKTFFDVKIPLKIVASEFKRREPRVLEKGLLIDAIMASCTMPGVFRPFKFSEELLFDGGVTNPLPTEPLFEMGIKKIIAVNVTPSREDIVRQYEKIKELAINPVSKVNIKGLFGLEQHFMRKFKTNILDIIFSTFEIMQSEMAKKEGQLADIVLHPDTQGMHWLELNRAKEFAQRGEEEIRKNLSRIWQIVNE